MTKQLPREQQVCEGCHQRLAVHQISYKPTGHTRHLCPVCFDQFPSPEELAFAYARQSRSASPLSLGRKSRTNTARRILALIMFALLGIASVVHAENADLKDLISGKQVPLALKLKDLDGTWRRVRVSASDAGALLGMYAQLMGGAGAGVYYTKGDVVVLAGITYVIAYQHPSKPIDMMALMRGGGREPEPEPFTPETSLTLTLVQLHTAGALADIRPFNLDQEIAERASIEKAIEGSQEEMSSSSSISNLKQIGLGLAMLTDTTNGKLPDLSTPQSLRKALAQYVTNDKVFVHPKTGKPYLPNPSFTGKLWQGPNAATDALVYEADPAADGTSAVLFGDGHVERVDETKWRELTKTSNAP